MTTDSPHWARAQAVFDAEIAALQQTRNRLDGQFNLAVDLLQATLANGGKIIVTGVGKSFHIGQKIAATFTSTGAPANVLHPSEAMHGDLGLVQAGDAVLALSYSGESDELVNLLPMLKRAGARVIALTGTVDSTLATHSDLVLDAAVAREACPFNMVPTASTTVALAIGDALVIALLAARGVTREEYARFHPGGAIGRALLLKVDDIMRTGERLAAVARTATIRDAVIAMTQAQAGAVAIINDDQKVVGLLTDGDLRRYLAAGATDVQTRPVTDLMTANPSTIHTGQLAADALAIFQKHRFDDLVVLNRDGTLAGIIDIQDLPKFKIL